jgi:hypothetical protein
VKCTAEDHYGTFSVQFFLHCLMHPKTLGLLLLRVRKGKPIHAQDGHLIVVTLTFDDQRVGGGNIGQCLLFTLWFIF